MRRNTQGFTLTELLVVLAIVVVLATVLLPVFLTAKSAALKNVCVMNFRQAHDAMSLYTTDYDDYFTPVNYQPGQQPDPQSDRTWVQLLLPYARSISIFHCPADSSQKEKGDGSFDEDLVPDDAYSKYYFASLHSNVGFNYIYLSPIIRTGNQLRVKPRMTTEVEEPSKTILYVDSVWNRDAAGNPINGGSMTVVPPCRFAVQGNATIDTFRPGGGSQTSVYVSDQGWEGNQDSVWLYGKAWPRHSGRMNVARVDGSISSMSPPQLSMGCDAKPKWQGLISSTASYLWDVRSL